MKELQDIVRLVLAENASWALATLVSVEGSSYRRAGARALFGPFPATGGKRIGSISGGCLEEDVSARAAEVAASGRPQVATYDTTSENDLVWGVGLGCHGVVRALIEPVSGRPAWLQRTAATLGGGEEFRIGAVWRVGDVADALGTRLEEEVRHAAFASSANIFWQTIRPPTALWIFGAGDDARPLSRMAAELGWAVTLADPRPGYARADRFPEASRLVTGRVEDLTHGFPVRGSGGPTHDVLAVIMTHHYVHDLPLLRDLIARPLSYLGLLGPRKRAERMLEEISRAGMPITPQMTARLHAPVGLDLGADGAEEVALSIIAEMRAVLADRDARPLRTRKGPIHD